MSIDILNTHSPEWMSNPGLPCVQVRPENDTKEALRAYGRAVDHRWAPDGAAREDMAKRNCAGCPVLTQCLTYALADPDLGGIWGGTTTQERHRLRTGNSECGTYAGYLRHRKADESACRQCSAANARASQVKRERAKGAA